MSLLIAEASLNHHEADISSGNDSEQHIYSSKDLSVISPANMLHSMNSDKIQPTEETVRDEAFRLKAIYSDRKLRTPGLTQSTVADLCDWSSQGTVSQYMNADRPLNIEALLKLATVLQFNPAEVSPRLANLYLQVPLNDTLKDQGVGQIETGLLEDGPQISRGFRRVQVVGTAQLGPEGYWDALAATDGYVDVPSSDPDAYALRVKGDSMTPAIRNNWVVWCEPNHALIPSEYVMVRRTNGECMVKELLYENETEVSLMAVNDGYGRLTIDREDIEQIHHVGGIVAPSKIKY